MHFNPEEIIEQIKKGNQNAFRKLVEEYQQYVFTIAFRIICNEEDARDAVQESFIKIWKNINDYRSTIKFTTWMYKIVTNTAIDRFRALKRKKTISLDGFKDQFTSLENPGRKLENAELGRLIMSVADGLPEKQRLVFILRDLQGMATKEVEVILNMKADALKSNLYHARKYLKTRLVTLLEEERIEK